MDSNLKLGVRNIHKNPRILVVEDDPVMRDVLKELLVSHGYHICLASNGLEALGCLEEIQFDLVITDLRMPKMGGLELYDEMSSRSLKVPVLVVTGTPHEILRCGDKKRCFAGFLTKPFDLQDFLSSVESACNQQSAMFKAS
jgi:CheY-like chemotaxis protein